MQRLPYDAHTEAEVRQYYLTRARQLLHEGFVWSRELQPHDRIGFRTDFERDGQRYESVYLLAPFRGRGLIGELLATGAPPFVTVGDCGMDGVFVRYGMPYLRAGMLLDSAEYRSVERFYGDGRAARSQAWLMNHIDEGLAILWAIGASDQAARAFCLHPLLQDDEPLVAHYAGLAAQAADQPEGAHVLGLALEYRSIANAYLSGKAMPEGGIRLSPLKEVNDMLIADKVQNRKDFERYHAASHPQRDRLAAYFDEWLAALGVLDRYESLKSRLMADTN